MKEVSDNIFFNVKEIETLSIPSKTVLLEEGKIADKIYLVRKGCLRLFFYNEGKDITFQFFFEGDFVVISRAQPTRRAISITSRTLCTMLSPSPRMWVVMTRW